MLRPLMPGLYVVATPIGNLRDITLRALDVLKAADVVACEDTRTSGVLLKHYGIRTKTMSLHEHNEFQRLGMLEEQVRSGQSVALITDAGTPLISDPGGRVVAHMREKGLPVTTVPGACAMVAGLTLSGLPTERFLMAGFLPQKTKARCDNLRMLAAVDATLVFYESPHRMEASLADMAAVLGGARMAAVAREITKLHEEVLRGTLDELVAEWQRQPRKGEMVIVVEPPAAAPAVTGNEEEVQAHLAHLLEEHSVKDAARMAAEAFGLSRNKAYELAQALKGGNG
ncbi:16S rRNA (cytidine(1402)-2'-O)-methyltransferase [bacterium]|nr:16S rRNA (cytidine(1402)-2'-O)-methyltransferase [bacterium]